MQEIDAKDCKAHILICVNDRAEKKPCCFDVGGLEFFTKLKSKLKESGLVKTHRATRTGCLGYCNGVGCTLVIHRPHQAPEWFFKVEASDFDTVWEKFSK